MIPDKHDERLFRHFAKFDAAGTLLAIVEVDAAALEPSDHAGNTYIDVTDLHPRGESASTLMTSRFVAAMREKKPLKTPVSRPKPKPRRRG